MAAHASFTAVDNLAANHIFTRVGMDGNSVRYQERVGDSSLSWKNLSTNLRSPLAGNGAKVYKVELKFTMPIVADEVINGVTVPKKIREYTKTSVLVIPSDGTQAERDMFVALSNSSEGTATLKDLTTLLLPLNGV